MCFNIIFIIKSSVLIINSPVMLRFCGRWGSGGGAVFHGVVFLVPGKQDYTLICVRTNWEVTGLMASELKLQLLVTGMWDEGQTKNWVFIGGAVACWRMLQTTEPHEGPVNTSHTLISFKAHTHPQPAHMFILTNKVAAVNCLMNTSDK